MVARRKSEKKEIFYQRVRKGVYFPIELGVRRRFVLRNHRTDTLGNNLHDITF